MSIEFIVPYAVVAGSATVSLVAIYTSLSIARSFRRIAAVAEVLVEGDYADVEPVETPRSVYERFMESQ